MNEQRRQPKQQRSRERVERILSATAEIVAADGLEGLTVRAVTTLSGVPAPTVYRYFADSDEIAAAFFVHEMEAINLAVARAFLDPELTDVRLRDLLEIPTLVHLRYHQEHPETLLAWFGNPRSKVVHERMMAQETIQCEWLQRAVDMTGMLREGSPPLRIDLISRMGDRLLDFVLTSGMSPEEQEDAVRRYIEMSAAYYDQNYASQRGLTGVPKEEWFAAIGTPPPAP